MLQTETVGSLTARTTLGVDPARSASLVRKEERPRETAARPLGRAALRVRSGEPGGSRDPLARPSASRGLPLGGSGALDSGHVRGGRLRPIVI
jgi:hypothetical protein